MQKKLELSDDTKRSAKETERCETDVGDFDKLAMLRCIEDSSLSVGVNEEHVSQVEQSIEKLLGSRWSQHFEEIAVL